MYFQLNLLLSTGRGVRQRIQQTLTLTFNLFCEAVDSNEHHFSFRRCIGAKNRPLGYYVVLQALKYQNQRSILKARLDVQMRRFNVIQFGN